MKIVMASTIEQEEKINDLIQQIKEDIFPRFFTKEHCEQMWKAGVLTLTESHLQSFSLLKDAFRVIASLQTIISILEIDEPSKMPVYYEEMFQRNVSILQEFNLSFPFHLCQFTYDSTIEKQAFFSIPANSFLV